MGHREVRRTCRFQTLVSAERADEWVEVTTSVDIVFLEFFIERVTADSVNGFINENGKVGVVMVNAFDVFKHADAGNIL